MMWSLASCPFSFSAMRTFWAQTELMLWYNSSTSSSFLRRKPRAIVRLSQIDGCSFWNDSGRVEFVDRIVIDHVVTWLYRRDYSRHLVELPHIIRQIRRVGDSILIAIEKRKIGHIEADLRRKQSQVSLGELTAHEVAPAGQPLLQLVEGRE